MTTREPSKERADIDIQSIVEQVQSGDTHDYAEIIRCFQKQIYIYCYYMLGTKEEAEDASQDIFIKGLENIHKFSYTVSLSAWLYKIAHHHCIDVIKAKNRGYKFWLSVKREQVKQTQAPIPEYDEMVHRLLENLHVDEKRILLLRSIEEYSFEEISEIMDMKPATIRKKYERLRKKLIKENKLGG
ncbi:RNA polymerase sigma factor, partial [Lysinibacillus capsici]